MSNLSNSLKSAVSKVFVGGLPQDWHSHHLAQFMSNFGRVVNVELKRDESGLSKGYGFAYLDDHLPLDQIYGRHDYYNASIEIKELKQKFIFIDLANASKKMTEANLERLLAEKGHHVEYIELGVKSFRTHNFFAKVSFFNEESAKYFLNRQFVELEGYQYSVSASTDTYRAKYDQQSANQTRGSRQGYQYQQPYITDESKGYGKEKQKVKTHKDSHQSDRNRQLTKEIKEESTNSRRLPFKEERDSLSPVGLNLKEEKLISQEIPEQGKTPRKLSYKGKDIDFHPKASVAVVNSSILQEVEDDRKSSSVTTVLSINSAKKDLSSIQSKLSPTSLDWNIEGQGFLNWPEAAAIASTMVFPSYPSVIQRSPFSNYAGGLSARQGVPESQLEQRKKKEVWIEFFTFPGCP